MSWRTKRKTKCKSKVSDRLRAKIEAGHLGAVSDEKLSLGEGGVIPGFAPDCLEAGEFVATLGSRTDEGEFAIAAEDYQIAAGQEELAIAIAAILPFAFTGCGIETGQNVFVEAIDISLPKDRAGEFVF